MGSTIKLFIPYAGLNMKDFIEATESQEELLCLLNNDILAVENIVDELNSLVDINTTDTSVSREDFKSVIDKIIYTIKMLVAKLVELFKSMISYVSKLFTKLTDIEEKFKSLEDEIVLSMEAYNEIGKLELDRLEKLVFLTWPYYHKYDNIKDVLDHKFKSFRMREYNITRSLYTIGEIMDDIMDKIGSVIQDKKYHPEKPFSIDTSLDNFEAAALKYKDEFNSILFKSGYKYLASVNRIPNRHIPSNVDIPSFNYPDLIKLIVSYKSIDNNHDKLDVEYRIKEQDFTKAVDTASKYKNFTRARVTDLGILYANFLKHTDIEKDIERQNVYDYLQRFVTGIEHSKEVLEDSNYIRYINTTKNLIVMFSLAHIATIKLYRENFKQALATLRLLYDVVKNKVN